MIDAGSPIEAPHSSSSYLNLITGDFILQPAGCVRTYTVGSRTNFPSVCLHVVFSIWQWPSSG